MMGFHQIGQGAAPEMLDDLHTVTAEHDHQGVFNPSFGQLGDLRLFAYRATPNGERGIRSYVAVGSHGSADYEVTDLTSIGDERGLTRVADPKVVDAGDALYVTFNTGFSAQTDNDIFLVRVAPTLGEFQRVVADFERQRVEKNWAFVLPSGGAPMAIYQLHPYKEVHLVSGVLGTSDDLRFELRAPARTVSDDGANLSIGTQVLMADDGSGRLLAHEKWAVRRKRCYFGRAVTIEGIGSDDAHVRVGRSRLIHRWQDALPRRTAHNRNLLSATYFSGLMRDGADVLVGYGINDEGHSIARLDGDRFWA